MKHPVLAALGSLAFCGDHDLERAVDDICAELAYPSSLREQAARAEALAILSHEFRRRSNEEE